MEFLCSESPSNPWIFTAYQAAIRLLAVDITHVRCMHKTELKLVSLTTVTLDIRYLFVNIYSEG